jgi:hypothetical protein
MHSCISLGGVFADFFIRKFSAERPYSKVSDFYRSVKRLINMVTILFTECLKGAQLRILVIRLHVTQMGRLLIVDTQFRQGIDNINISTYDFFVFVKVIGELLARIFSRII